MCISLTFHAQGNGCGFKPGIPQKTIVLLHGVITPVLPQPTKLWAFTGGHRCKADGPQAYCLCFKCPTTKQMRCPVNDYKQFCRETDNDAETKQSYFRRAKIFKHCPRSQSDQSVQPKTDRYGHADIRLFPGGIQIPAHR